MYLINKKKKNTLKYNKDYNILMFYTNRHTHTHTYP